MHYATSLAQCFLLPRAFLWESATRATRGLEVLYCRGVCRDSHPGLITQIKQLQRRSQRQLQKTNRFNDQNNSSARASRSLVHFFDVHSTTTTWNLPIWRFVHDVDIRRRISFLFLNLNKILKNSTAWKVASIWRVERVQIDAIKFEGTQNSFFGDVFTVVVVVAA